MLEVQSYVKCIGCARAEKGKKAFGYRKNSVRRMTALVSISDKSGMGLTEIFEGIIATEIFVSYIKRLILYFQEKKQQINCDQVF